MTPRLLMLGPPALDTGGEPEPVVLDTPTSLLLYLAYRGTWVARSELAFLYCSDVPESSALGYLRKLVYRAKRLPFAAALETSPKRLRWRVDTDVTAFNRAVGEADWEGAVRLYRGPLLCNVELSDAPSYSAWLDLERSDLERRWITAVQKRGRELEGEGRVSAALELVAQLAERDPFDEDVLQTRLRLLTRAERGGEALRLYTSFCEGLAREVGAAPLEATQALADSIKRQTQAGQRTLVDSRHTLPADTTRFVGREQERAELRGKLEQYRLVTVIGLGGTGKTRLALACGRELLGRYRDGVHFVGLAGAASGDAVVATIADGLRLTLRGSSDPIDQLGEFLSDRHALLILDNFEHLKEHAGVLESFLARAPGLTLLVTSREALELHSECLFDLHGLAFPTAGEELARHDSVALFLNRAERASRDFVLSDDTLQAVAEICRLVEGLPLALELTATWTRSLSCADIAATLKNDLGLLSTPLKGVPERQRSIVGVFDHSFEHLSDLERRALLSLAVFEGGFDLEAAEEVAGADLSLILGLMNRALVRREGADRYALHELLRQYLTPKIGADERQRLAEAHAGHYLGKLARYEAALRGPRPRLAQETLLVDMDNLRKAYRVSLRTRGWQRLRQAQAGLKQLFFSTGLFKEAASFYSDLQAQLQHAPGEQARSLRVQTSLSLARAQGCLGNTPVAELEQLKRSLSGTDQNAAYAETLYLLGHDACEKGAFGEAQKLYLEGLRHVNARDDSVIRGDLLEGLATVAWAGGDHPAAVGYLRDLLAVSEQEDDAASVVAACLLLSNRLKYVGDPQSEAEGLIEKALTFQNDIGPYLRASLLNDHALRYFENADYTTSEALFRESLKLSEQTSDRLDSAVISYNLARALREQARYREAEEMFERSMAFSPIGTLQFVGLAETERLQNRKMQAKTYLLKALAWYADKPQPLNHLLDAFICLARLYRAEHACAPALELASFVYHHEGSGQHQKDAVEPLYLSLRRELGNPATERTEMPQKSLQTHLHEQLSALGQKSQ